MKFFTLSTVTSAFLLSQITFAAALTVKESDVVDKVREVSVNSVRLDSGPATILTDAARISIYTFDIDTNGVSNCKGGCLKEWPILHVDANETLVAPFAKITGNDGKPQLTLNGHPLYYYTDDQKPGDVLGDYPKWHPITVIK